MERRRRGDSEVMSESGRGKNRGERESGSREGEVTKFGGRERRQWREEEATHWEREMREGKTKCGERKRQVERGR